MDLDLGVLICPKCFLRRKHLLRWPQEAYFQIDYRDQTLWAFDRQMALDLLGFIKSDERDRHAFQYSYSLRKTPSYFLTAKGRPAIVKKLEQVLVVS